MIQRKQTIFLLVAALCMGSATFLPLVEYVRAPGAESFIFKADALYNGQGIVVPDFKLSVPFLWLYAFLGAALLAVVFLYRQRVRQMRFVHGLMLVSLGAFVGQVFVHSSLASYLGTRINVASSFKVGFVLPLIAVVFIWLAGRGIKADEALVKSTDRLR